MTSCIGFSEAEPEFKGTPGASFSRLLLEAGQHAEQHPSTLDQMVGNALRGTQAGERKKAVEWLWQNAPFLFKA